MKRGKLLKTIGFTLLIGIISVLMACAAPVPAPKPAPAPTPAPPPMQPVELKFATHLPETASLPKFAFKPWGDEINERTKGLVKTTFYFAETLVKSADTYDAVISGICDVSYNQHSATPGRFPLMNVIELPFLGPSTEVSTHILRELYDKFPEMKAEHKDVQLLYLWVTLPLELHTNKKPVRTLEDIKGMKIATLAAGAPALEKLGASPVVMATPKFYESLEKGVVDGVAIAWGALGGWRLYEVTKYHTNAHVSAWPTWTAMNKNTWNKLPPDIQKIVTEVSAKGPERHMKAVKGEMDETIAKVKELGHEIIDLPPAELAKWSETGKPAWDKWAADMTAKGLPGKAILDEAVKLLEKYAK